MDWHIRRCRNRLSLLLSSIATFSLFHLLLRHHYDACSATAASLLHPSSSCDPLLRSRPHLPLDLRSQKIASSFFFTKRSSSFFPLIQTLASLRLLHNSSHLLCSSSGAGHDALAFRSFGVQDVTAVDLFAFPPFVERSDPHNLPFFDESFDLGFSAELDSALFPRKFTKEMERTVRRGGAVAVVVGRAETEKEIDEIRDLFRRSSLVEVRNVTLNGSPMSLIVMKRNGGKPS